jgi:aminoglycoside-2''-adenylyltransferase
VYVKEGITMTSFSKSEALATLQVLSGLRSPVWLVGGLAADFHIGRWTRDHGDIDLVGFEDDRDASHAELAELGFERTDDRGWITHWTRAGRDIGEVSLAFLRRSGPTTGDIVILREYGAWVPGIYPGIAGSLDPAAYKELEGVRFRVSSAEAEWLYTKGFATFRPGALPRPTVEHNLRLFESVIAPEELVRLETLVGRRLPLPE